MVPNDNVIQHCKSDAEFHVWLKHKIYYSWHKKYQHPSIFRNWFQNLTTDQLMGFYKQFTSDKHHTYVQKTENQVV